MSELWYSLGYIRWPLAFSGLLMLLVTAYSAARLFRPGAIPDVLTRTWVDAVLFWGSFAMIAGVLGTLVGIVVAAQSIEAAGAVSSSLVWGGIKVALLSSVVGTVMLAASALLWFGLQLRWRFLAADELDEI
jgi:hypothetical protein